MKRISAVICELNPIHGGHRHILKCAADGADLLIAVMSGNFVQRGECAVYDKYKRAAAALEVGVDVVLEIPFPFSASSAEYFASSGVRIAEGVGATDLYFGSECADLDAIRRAAKILDDSNVKRVGRAAEMREEILRNSGEDFPESVYSSPNDILAVEYMRSLTVGAHPIKRIEAESASALRSRIFEAHSDKNAVYPEALTRLEFYHYRTASSHGGFAESGGGVGERLYRCAMKTNDSSMWLGLAATKQYTNSRLRRAALFEVCAVTKDMLKNGVKYTRVLAANSRGREYLKSIRDKAKTEIVTNHSERKYLSEAAREQYEKGAFADRIYSLCAGKEDPAAFVKASPVIR